MYPFESAGCLGAPISVIGICQTSVNRCAPSEGIGIVCAFGPDGGVFVTVGSDNNILTGAGWRFEEPLTSFPDPSVVPSDEIATMADGQECSRAACASLCPAVHALPIGDPFCPEGGAVDAQTMSMGAEPDRASE
jgi:hypothetical protein